MGEREYRIKDGLLHRAIDAFKAVTVAYHALARFLPFEHRKRMRIVADEADATAEALKKEMRKQDGQE